MAVVQLDRFGGSRDCRVAAALVLPLALPHGILCRSSHLGRPTLWPQPRTLAGGRTVDCAAHADGSLHRLSLAAVARSTGTAVGGGHVACRWQRSHRLVDDFPSGSRAAGQCDLAEPLVCQVVSAGRHTRRGVCADQIGPWHGARWRDPEAKKRSPLGGIRRRTVLGAIFGVVWASATLKARKGVAAPLRPPGAVPEDRFTGLCIRCGNCSRACPTNIISHQLGSQDIAGLLTPQVSFHADYCLETCNLCTEVCPSGALQPIPLDLKVHVPLGTPFVDMDLCLLGDDRECSHCRNYCPYEAISLQFSEELYTLTPIVNLDRCPGCGACQVACPTRPQRAIVVRPGR